ncbi:GNAT family N-acetyltransferase [Shewanella youngdeokensis]|uniref:GNAT family N-acetyltransferase n=1 Tax=Shewanella youngdeokensis TaxID=2999068 RepID=A0ABZ0K2N8_9GAMM|nr:GNAT family N-acetyltransferase [Shewanella sp. DAU334]
MDNISTDRLNISIMSLEDEELLFDLDQNPEVMRYINGGKITSRTDITDIYIPRLASYLTPSKGWGLWKVVQKANLENIDERQHFLGWILIRPMGFFSEKPDYTNLEIGWRFKQSAWGQGIATESARAVIELLVKHQADIERFSAIADENNIASINIMKKLGMSFINTQQHPDIADDYKIVLYSMKVNRSMLIET